MGEQQSRRILEGLSIDPATFRDSVEDPTREADHLFLLRHTLPQTGSITTTVSSGDCSSSAERRPIDGIQRKQG